MPSPRDDLNDLSLPDLYARFEATGLVRRLLELARDEDLGGGGSACDVTSRAVAGGGKTVYAELNAREPCVVAGLACLPELLRVFGADRACALHGFHRDGTSVSAGQTLAAVTGPASMVLTVERTMLNLVSRLSGVATLTSRFVARMEREAPRSPARLYDTRKTTPGLRVLEKYAVRCGGGSSHRLGLHDAVLIKDNHLAGVPLEILGETVRAAAGSARSRAPHGLRFVEVEVDSLEQLGAVLAIPALPDGTRAVDIILLDNMSTDQLSQAVAMRNAILDAGGRSVELEASGGVRLDTVGAIAATGVDRISCGALTHQAVSVDIGLDIRAD